jgi:hypothetical protein
LVRRVRLVLLVLRVLQDRQVLLVRLVFQLDDAFLVLRGLLVRLALRVRLVLQVHRVRYGRLVVRMGFGLSACLDVQVQLQKNDRYHCYSLLNGVFLIYVL